ncbi:MAG: hypothetical protein Kow0010_16410 [Dehalococcoidia bacterium]
MRKLDMLIIFAVLLTFAGVIGAAVAFTWLNAQGRPETEPPVTTVEAEQVRQAGGSRCDAGAGVCVSEVEPGRFVAVDAVTRHPVFGERGCEVEFLPPSEGLTESFGDVAAGGVLRKPCGGLPSDVTGVRVFGPAEGDLYRHPVSLSDGPAVVDLGRQCAGTEGCS